MYIFILILISSIRWRMFNQNKIMAFADFVIFSNLFRVLAGYVSCVWPVPDFLFLSSLRVFLGKVFLATLLRPTGSFSLITLVLARLFF